MRRLFKIFVYLILLVVVLAGLGVGAFLYAPSGPIARFIEDQTAEATGRKLTIDGEIERSLFPNLGVKTGAIRFENADWADSGPLLEADGVEVSLNLGALLTGGFSVETAALISPKIIVEIAEDGRRSFDVDGVDVDSGARAEAEERIEDAGDLDFSDSGDTIDIVVKSLAVTDGQVTIVDRRAGGRTIEIADLSLSGSLPSLEEALSLQGSAVAQGRRATLDVRLDNPAALNRGEAASGAAELSAEGVRAALSGDFSAPAAGAAPAAQGEVALALSGDKDLTAWVRAFLPPELDPLGAVDLKGAYSASEEGLSADLSGVVGFRGRDTDVKLTASAGEGWMEGQSLIQTDVSVKNDLVDAGYGGLLGASASGAPVIAGDYRISAPDVQALTAWAGAPAPAPADPAAKLESVALTGKVDLNDDGLNAGGDGAIGFNGRAVKVGLGAGGGADWDAGGAVDLRLDAASDGLFTAGWTGSVVPGDAPAVTGDARFETAALRSFFEWLGLGPVDAPAGTFERLSFQSAVAVTADGGGLNGLNVTLDDSAVTGDVAYSLDGPRPAVTATLKSGPLDLRPFTRAASGGGGAGAGSRGGGDTAAVGGGGPGGGWSREPIDLGVLNLVDVSLDVETEGVTTDVIRFGKARFGATVDAGKLTADVREMALYGGQATGSAVIDGSGATPAMSVDADISGVQLRPLLRDAADMDWLEGTGSATIDVAGAGASQDALMRSLGGSASIDFRNGAIIGYNLAAIVRNITTLGQGGGEEQKTDFAEMRASFQISNGVARNEDFFMAGPLVRLTGAGAIDIGAQTINYRAVPKAVATLQGQGGGQNLSGIAFPVLIQGPWSNPSVTPDLAGGAIESIEGILADPEGAGAFLKELGGGEGGDLGGVIDNVLGGGGEGGAEVGGGALGDVLRGVTGGGDGENRNPLGGLFGN